MGAVVVPGEMSAVEWHKWLDEHAMQQNPVRNTDPYRNANAWVDLQPTHAGQNAWVDLPPLTSNWPIGWEPS